MCDKRQASLGVSEGAGLARAWRQATEHSTGVLTLHSSSNHGPETVMALDSIPATWAATRMVAKAVSDTVAQGAMRVFRRDGQAEAELHHHAEEAGRNMEPKSLAGGGVEPGPRARKLEEAQMAASRPWPGARSCEITARSSA